MGEQPVKAYAQSQSPRDPEQKDRNEEPLPREEEERRHCPDVKRPKHKRDFPIQPILAGLIVPLTVKLQGHRRGHGLPIDCGRLPGRRLFEMKGHSLVISLSIQPAWTRAPLLWNLWPEGMTFMVLGIPVTKA
jgi:hypothetical protein